MEVVDGLKGGCVGMRVENGAEGGEGRATSHSSRLNEDSQYKACLG
jgi:hypothetical protein